MVSLTLMFAVNGKQKSERALLDVDVEAFQVGLGRLGCRAAGGFGEDAEPVAAGAGVMAPQAADIAAFEQQHRIVGA